MEVGMLDCKPCDTPMAMNQRLKLEDGATPADKGQYQRLVGKLICLSHT